MVKHYAMLAGSHHIHLLFASFLTVLRGHVQWLTCVAEGCVNALYDVDTKKKLHKISEHIFIVKWYMTVFGTKPGQFFTALAKA